MARPREFDVDEALEAAMQVFWEKGYQGSSLHDLLDAMQIARGSLYKAFKDKRSIYLAALERYEQVIVDDAVKALKNQSDGSPKDRIQNLLMRAVRAVEMNDDRRGCLLCNAAVDLLPEDPETRDIIFSKVKRLEGALSDVVAEYGDEKNWPHEKSQTLALSLNTTYMGMRMMARAGYSPQEMRSVVNLSLQEFV